MVLAQGAGACHVLGRSLGQNKASPGPVLGDKLGQRWPPQKRSTMATLKCKATGTGAALTPGPEQSFALWGWCFGAQDLAQPHTPLPLLCIPPSCLSHGAPQIPKCLNPWDLLNPAEGSAKPLSLGCGLRAPALPQEPLLLSAAR